MKMVNDERMTKRHHRYLIRALVLLGLALTACNKQPPESTTGPALQSMTSPARPGSGEPNLFADAGGRVLMSWIEAAGDSGHALCYSILQRDDETSRRGQGPSWSSARTIARGSDWFVNWADFPSVVSLDDATLAAHWLAKKGEGTYAYDVMISRSRDRGETWSLAAPPYDDATETEHGFVSMLPWPGGRLLVVWLDGRNFAVASGGDDRHPARGGAADTGGNEGHGGHDEDADMTLRCAFLEADGELTGETLLDERTCECCQTAAALTRQGAIVAYRDRSPEEIRDISFVRYDGLWSEPQSVYEDGWTVPGCPVNGPALAGNDERIACAWFTNAGDTPRVKIAFSMDDGRSFGKPLIIDDGDPLGRVDVVLLENGSALVSWMEVVGEAAEVRIREISADRVPGESMTVSSTSSERASGFPRMAYDGHDVYLAWTMSGDPSRIETARLSLTR